jgi:hypothetical protein
MADTECQKYNTGEGCLQQILLPVTRNICCHAFSLSEGMELPVKVATSNIVNDKGQI